MKKITVLLLAATIGLFQLTTLASAQTKKAEPKNEVTKLKKARKKNHYARQTTPSPKKSPAKHADNLSKNVNHELNRESKDINHAFQNHPKPKTPPKKIGIRQSAKTPLCITA